MENQRVRKAVIPAAGLGTRFLPATKAMPKEMLPIVDIPTLQYIVEEAVASGIEEILIITNSNKRSMEDHFDRNYELEERLKAAGKNDLEEMIRHISDMVNIYYVRQKEPKGLGHAILCTKSFIGEEPFAVLLGDDLVVNEGGEPALKQLVGAYNEKRTSVVGVQRVPMDEVNKYGIVEPQDKNYDPDKRRIKLKGMVEKPSIDQSPGDLAVLGRYVLTPEIFDLLETQAAGKNGEIQLTDAILRLMDIQTVYAYRFEGTRYDVGDKFGFVKATIDFALKRPELKDELSAYIKELASKI
ncbi:MAG: UTP--glucose-1-phosphate uridylyltransferase GalU [Lachnospiraceae bacterium]|nr:UTP--glucose-1-phosphate uridylyltransferase GalU [Lachnospiraceae bacterium]